MFFFFFAIHAPQFIDALGLRERLLRLSDLDRVAKTFMSGNGDFDSETVYGKPVQVISIDENENTFSLNEENLNLVLSRIPAKMKLSVVNVVGAFRTGEVLSIGFFFENIYAIHKTKWASTEQPFYIENKVRW